MVQECGVGGKKISDMDSMVLKIEVNMVLKRRAELNVDLESIYGVIQGQSSKPIIEKVEAQEGYRVVHNDRDPIGLLKLIKGVMFNYNSRRARAVTIIEIIQPNFVSQLRYMTASEYLEKFRTTMDGRRDSPPPRDGYRRAQEGQSQRPSYPGPECSSRIQSHRTI